MFQSPYCLTNKGRLVNFYIINPVCYFLCEFSVPREVNSQFSFRYVILILIVSIRIIKIWIAVFKYWFVRFFFPLRNFDGIGNVEVTRLGDPERIMSRIERYWKAIAFRITLFHDSLLHNNDIRIITKGYYYSHKTKTPISWSVKRKPKNTSHLFRYAPTRNHSILFFFNLKLVLVFILLYEKIKEV